MATSEKELLPWQQDVLREKADLEVVKVTDFSVLTDKDEYYRAVHDHVGQFAIAPPSDLF